MTLGFPLGLLALAAIPALFAAYFLRRKQPPRVVSALFLWRTPDQRAEAGPRFERFSRELSLALETLAVIAAALFLADARCGETAPKRHVIVVVDGSLSMAARTDGKTSAERVKDAVAALVKSENAGVLTLIESGVRPMVLAGPQQEVDRALSALEAWQPAQPAHDATAALSLGRELATSSDQRVFFFTDGPLPESVTMPPQVEARSVGQAADNVAILTAQRRDEGGAATITVRVGNFSDKAKKVTVHFEAKDDAPQSQSVDLGAGASAVLRVGFKTKGEVTVSVPDDALSEDGRVTLLPSPLSEVTIGFIDGLEPNALAAVKRFVSVASGVKVEVPALLTIGPPATNAKLTIGATGKLKSFVGPFFAQKGNALLDDVQLGGVVWTAGENPPGRVLMSMGEVVLISEEDSGELHFNLDVSRSNVQRTVAWPVLLGNVVRQARLGAPGLPRKHLMLGEEVPVVTLAGAKWELRNAKGASRPVLGVGALQVPALPSPGRWQLLRDGEPFDALEVLPLDPRESDLRTRGPWEVNAARKEALASLATTHPRPWWPIALILALLLVDFWLTARVPRASAAPKGAT